jgi:SH3-like domain-containing protein
MANRSDRGSGQPDECLGRDSPYSRMGPDPRIPSWPAVQKTPRQQAGHKTVPDLVAMASNILATREPSTQDKVRSWSYIGHGEEVALTVSSSHWRTFKSRRSTR